MGYAALCKQYDVTTKQVEAITGRSGKTLRDWHKTQHMTLLMIIIGVRTTLGKPYIPPDMLTAQHPEARPKIEPKKKSKPKPKLEEVKPDEEAVISTLNREAKKLRGFSANSKDVRDYLRPRLKTYTVDDCILVTVTKCRQWVGTKYERNLNPKTLFREGNFERYLNDAQEEQARQQRGMSYGRSQDCGLNEGSAKPDYHAAAMYGSGITGRSQQRGDLFESSCERVN